MEKELKEFVKSISDDYLVVILSSSLDEKAEHKLFNNLSEIKGVFYLLQDNVSENKDKFSILLEKSAKNNLKDLANTLQMSIVLFLENSSEEFFKVVEPYCDVLIIQKVRDSFIELDIRKHRSISLKVIKVNY